ncbi:MAG: 6-oxocyclohex-1-ene-1-carbonyl-CoA hydratase [Planctomycetes bacterium]|nr:6-oxocyclohex-1-ene-1-carbonyl-CoA hydratase [Planctomycetota bacterium]
MFDFKNHDLVEGYRFEDQVRYERRPLTDGKGGIAHGLYSTWITLDNPSQFNSYTTRMVKDVILAMRSASEDRASVAVVFTGAGDRAFCTGGNTKEYAEYYAGRPEEYKRYMRLFNDMVTAILHVDKPVICRANGMRIGGGQEIGMACDFTVSSDLANYGQAGPKHGSAPIGGSTDFLPLYVGVEEAMYSCTVCEPWSAYKAKRLGLLSEVVPVLEVEGRLTPNPLVVTDRWIDDMGRIVFGEFKAGDAAAKGKEILKSGKTNLAHLDAKVNDYLLKLATTMPGCLEMTVLQIRKHKLLHWDRNREDSRQWLGLNMMNEANAGFRAFNEGTKECREADFLELRRKLAAGEKWSEDLVESILPKNRKS